MKKTAEFLMCTHRTPCPVCLSMIKQCGETWAVTSRDHSKSAQVARPVSSMNAVAGFPYL